MNFSSSLQKLIMILAIMALSGYVIYSTIFTGESVVVVEGLPIETVGQDIIVLADKLDNINFQKNIFSSPLFTNLIDTGSPIVEETVGKTNPFSQVGGGPASRNISTVR